MRTLKKKLQQKKGA